MLGLISNAFTSPSALLILETMKSTTPARLAIGKSTPAPSAVQAITADSLLWLIDHAAEAYKNEIEATDKLKERISFILSLAVTPSIAAAIFLASGLKGELFNSINVYFFWVPWVAAVALLMASAALVAHTLLRGFLYERVPLPSEILGYFEQHPEPSRALEEAHLGLLKEYTAAVDHNFRKNQKRSNSLLWAQRLAFLSLLFFFVSLPRWIYNSIHSTPEPQPIKIVSPIEILKEKEMSNKPNEPTPSTSQPQTTQSQGQPSTPPATQTTTSQQARPVFPKRTMVLDAAIETPRPNAHILNETKKSDK